MQSHFRGDGRAASLPISNCRDNSYCVLYDPIDGSSNTDVNGSLGTIFAVRKRAAKHGKGIEDLLGPGSQQVVAGYIAYGPSTQLVYTAGAGVDIFTLDRSLGEFLLWKENVKTPAHGSTYAVNQGNAGKWHRRRPQIPRAHHEPQG